MAFTPITLATPTIVGDSGFTTTYDKNLFSANNPTPSTGGSFRYNRADFTLTSANYTALLRINKINFTGSGFLRVDIDFSASDNLRSMIEIANDEPNNNYIINLTESGYVSRQIATISKDDGIEIFYKTADRSKVIINNQEYTFNSLVSDVAFNTSKITVATMFIFGATGAIVTDFAYLGVSYSTENFATEEERNIIRNIIFRNASLYRPEIGWKRIQNSDSPHFEYTNLTLNTNSAWNGGSSHICITDVQWRVRFKFYGTKLRILGSMASNRPSKVNIKIDGVVQPQYSNYHSGTDIYSTAVYEKTNLNLDTHEVEIWREPTDPIFYFDFDGIDIDDNGKFLYLDLTERFTLDSMEVGDVISCDYFASAGTTGVFSNLGSSIKTILDKNPNAAVNGSFYFIKVDNGLLIADRGVQDTLSFQALSLNGFIDGKPVFLSGENVKIRVLRSGIGFITSDGTLAAIEKNLGGYPLNNEWDKYILNSTLNGKITAGDSVIWNFDTSVDDACNISLDTLIKSSTATNGQAISDSTWHVVKGVNLGATTHNKGLNGWNGTAYDGVSFRPVLEYIDAKLEVENRPKTVWY